VEAGKTLPWSTMVIIIVPRKIWKKPEETRKLVIWCTTQNKMD
jgi:hypothetical protein